MLKKSKAKLLEELEDRMRREYFDVDMMINNTPSSVMRALDQHIMNRIKIVLEVIADNAYCQEDFEKDVGVRDEH